MAELGLAERDDAADEGLILILAVPLLPPQQREDDQEKEKEQEQEQDGGEKV